MFIRRVYYVILFVLILIIQTSAQNDNVLSMGFGVAGLADHTRLVESRFEFRPDKKLFLFFPLIGIMVMGDGSKYFYGGINLDQYFGNHLVVTPNFAFGGYHNGGKKDLGGVIEFRSGVEVGYWVLDQVKLGLAFHHVSNASIYEENPGTETLTLMISVRSKSDANKNRETCFDTY